MRCSCDNDINAKRAYMILSILISTCDRCVCSLLWQIRYSYNAKQLHTILQDNPSGLQQRNKARRYIDLLLFIFETIGQLLCDCCQEGDKTGWLEGLEGSVHNLGVL